MKLEPRSMAVFAVSVCVVLVGVAPSSSHGSPRQPRLHRRKTNFTVALVLPKIVFGTRKYQKAVNDAITALYKSRSPRFEFLNTHGHLQVYSEMISMTPNPTGSCPRAYCRKRRRGARVCTSAFGSHREGGGCS